MSEPLFFIQIVDTNGRVATLPGGGSLEANLIDLFTQRILAQQRGLFRTEKQLRVAIHDGISEAILMLKAQTVQLVQ